MNEPDPLYAEVVRLREDAARLDYLEAEANREPLLLHAREAIVGYRGLGLANTRRTLRQAIDDMRAPTKYGHRNKAKAQP